MENPLLFQWTHLLRGEVGSHVHYHFNISPIRAINSTSYVFITNIFQRYQRSLVSGSDLDHVDGVQAVSGKVLLSVSGEFVLDNVPIVTPNGDVIVPSLSLKVIKTLKVFFHRKVETTTTNLQNSSLSFTNFKIYRFYFY